MLKESRRDGKVLERRVLMGYQSLLELTHHRVSRIKDIAYIVFDALPEEDVSGAFV
jgi:hypothetical protein